MSDVEETIKRIQQQRGVTGVLVMDSIGMSFSSLYGIKNLSNNSIPKFVEIMFLVSNC